MLRSFGLVLVVAVAAIAGSCGSESEPGLSIDSTWQWQLQGVVNTGYEVDMYDLDLFDVSAETIGQLHADGRVVICYFSAGSYEEWRVDASVFDADSLGEPLDGWEGERWLDIRSPSVRSVMTSRLDRAAEQGCDGVEPDNVTGFSNDTGFDLDYADQIKFNRFLAAEAHQRGLLIGLKNDLVQIVDLVDDFDFAVNEECFEFDECEANQLFIDKGKPVFSAEYADKFVNDSAEVCAKARAAQHRTLILPLDLDDSFRIACDDGT